MAPKKKPCKNNPEIDNDHAANLPPLSGTITAAGFHWGPPAMGNNGSHIKSFHDAGTVPQGSYKTLASGFTDLGTSSSNRTDDMDIAFPKLETVDGSRLTRRTRSALPLTVPENSTLDMPEGMPTDMKQKLTHLRDYGTKLMARACHLCKRNLFINLDLIHHVESWPSLVSTSRTHSRKKSRGDEHPGSITCSSTFCAGVTCLGCGNQHTAASRDVGWCCDEGRMAAIWMLLSYLDKKLLEAEAKTNLSSTPDRYSSRFAKRKSPKTKSKLPAGVGYLDGDYDHDYYSDYGSPDDEDVELPPEGIPYPPLPPPDLAMVPKYVPPSKSSVSKPKKSKPFQNAPLTQDDLEKQLQSQAEAVSAKLVPVNASKPPPPPPGYGAPPGYNSPYGFGYPPSFHPHLPITHGNGNTENGNKLPTAFSQHVASTLEAFKKNGDMSDEELSKMMEQFHSASQNISDLEDQLTTQQYAIHSQQAFTSIFPGSSHTSSVNYPGPPKQFEPTAQQATHEAQSVSDLDEYSTPPTSKKEGGSKSKSTKNTIIQASGPIPFEPSGGWEPKPMKVANGSLPSPVPTSMYPTSLPTSLPPPSGWNNVPPAPIASYHYFPDTSVYSRHRRPHKEASGFDSDRRAMLVDNERIFDQIAELLPKLHVPEESKPKDENRKPKRERRELDMTPSIPNVMTRAASRASLGPARSASSSVEPSGIAIEPECPPIPIEPKPTTFDANPPTILFSLLEYSFVLNMISRVLSDDSIDRMVENRGLYLVMLQLVSVLNAHPETKALVNDGRGRTTLKGNSVGLHELTTGPWDLSIEGRSAKDMEVPLSKCLENLSVVSKSVLETAEVMKKQYKSGKELLQLCNRIKQVQLEVDTQVEASSETVEKVPADPWKEFCAENRVDMVETEDILTHYCYNQDKDKASVPVPRSGPSSGGGSKIKRLVHEIGALRTSLPDGVFLKIGTSRPDIMKIIIIGPRETAYAHGLYEFDLFCPANYPNQPPLVHFKTPETIHINPNLHHSGTVCLSLLGTWGGSADESWRPGVSNLFQVLVSMQSMVFCSNPIANEPGDYRVPESHPRAQQYNAAVQALNVRYGMLEWLRRMKRDKPLWIDIVRKHLQENGLEMLKTVRQWAKDNEFVRKYAGWKTVEEVCYIGRFEGAPGSATFAGGAVGLQTSMNAAAPNFVGRRGAYKLPDRETHNLAIELREELEAFLGVTYDLPDEEMPSVEINEGASGSTALTRSKSKSKAKSKGTAVDEDGDSAMVDAPEKESAEVKSSKAKAKSKGKAKNYW